MVQKSKERIIVLWQQKNLFCPILLRHAAQKKIHHRSLRLRVAVVLRLGAVTAPVVAVKGRVGLLPVIYAGLAEHHPAGFEQIRLRAPRAGLRLMVGFTAAALASFILFFPYASGIMAPVSWLDLGKKFLRIWY